MATMANRSELWRIAVRRPCEVNPPFSPSVLTHEAVEDTGSLLSTYPPPACRPGPLLQGRRALPVSADTYFLFPPLLPLVLCVLQHLLPPQVKKVGRIGVELQALLPIIPLAKQQTDVLMV